MSNENPIHIEAPILSIGELQIPPPKVWEKFEKLIRDLQQAEQRDLEVQLHGRSGQRQNGVDSFGWSESLNGWIGIQCKLKDRNLGSVLTVGELRKEVGKAKTFKPKLKKYIVATTSPRDVVIQEEARKITHSHRKRGDFSVHVCAWDDVIDLLAKHVEIFRSYYGHYMQPPSSTHQPLFPEHTMNEVLGAGATHATGNNAAADIRVLSAPATHALGLLATSPMPYPRDAYERLFPSISWKSIVPQLIEANAVVMDGSILRVAEKTKSLLFPSAADRTPFVDTWFGVLEPLRHHVDMALFLSLLYITNSEPEKAFDLVVDIAADLERGFWNTIYISILESFKKPAFLKRLTPSKRRSYYSTYGICLARSNNPEQAIPWAKKLLQEGKKARDHWSVSQAYLLFGLANQYTEQPQRAAEFYNTCARYAKRHRVYFLVGHALHNLAMLKSHDEPDEAERLLELSIVAKKKAGDEPGRVGALFGRGSLAISQRQFATAVKWFSRAEKLAAKWDMQHSRALALSNIGNALVDLGKPRESLPFYSRAIKIAEVEGYPDASALSIGGSANANLTLKRYQRAHDLFLRLKTVQTEMEDHEAAVVAHHDAGACLLFAKQPADARTVLAAAYEEAVQYELPEWIYRCAKDMALTYKESEGDERSLRELRQAAKREEGAGRCWVAAKLWESVATLLHDRDGGTSEIEAAFEQAIRCLEISGEHFDELCRLISGLYQHRWDAGHYDSAVDALRTMEQVATKARNREMQARALDQIGMCLQQLGKINESIPYHRRALTIARRLTDTELAENCLNNLGEGLRKANKSDAAILLFEEAEQLARKRTDIEAEISIAHNRSLALEDVGRRRQAYRILVRCRDVALKSEFWEQYVRALHGLANHFWLTAKPDAAVIGYRKAFREARRHGFDEQAATIAINYANALRHKAQHDQAFRVLESVSGAQSPSPETHEFLSALATSAAETGNVENAKAAFDGAIHAAKAVKDWESAASASAGLADLLDAEGDRDGADALLKAALSGDISNGQKASLLTQRLGLLLRAGQTRKASAVFRQIEELVGAAGLHEEAVNAHMLLGDHEWEHGKSRLEAMKAYIAAIVPASSISIEVMIQTGSHAIKRLLSLDPPDRSKQIERIQVGLQGWLSKEVGPTKIADAERIMLWPLRIALHISQDPNGTAMSSSRAMTHLLQAELFNSVENPSTPKSGQKHTDNSS